MQSVTNEHSLNDNASSDCSSANTRLNVADISQLSSPSLPGFFESCVPIKGLIIGHLNIRSIKAGNKLEELKLLLLQKPTVHILSLSETWLLNECWSDKMLAIDDNSLDRRDRSSGGQGGGTAIYLHSSITYCVRHDLITDTAL